ncbi:DEAD/DEAH box helicase [Acinetobacter baumannii]|uniref:DEAD/DEAH box helicase n=1 Tax=Acinetobacter baumannii TaxID=470 RepID=UPI0018FF2D2F|nr:type ISP restriction/modification enzyme [Acinetobacter baumannii]MBJ9484044.1 DEAD/DEAH box helicase [Acinetobacter baumannii]MBJ9912023.1 DEAD/DEAH box helicase [Acinetobacter baumannii]MBJ9946400.1 DEAD/DEAH box helicase [Acinetobacter baumannii]
MSSFFQLIDTFRTTAKTEREKGTYFELLCIKYFKNEPFYTDLFSDVQTYTEWAKTQGLSGKDTGIDLVATTKDGEFHAIQCKLYDANSKVTKAEIDSFLSAASKTYFKRRIIVSTTHEWSDNALATLENQDPPVTKIDLDTLAQSAIDWSLFAEKKEVAFKPKKELRDHQKAALANVKAGLYEQKLERGKLIMACGTGKTFTSLKIAEACAGKGKRVLFLVPSLSLLSQTLTEWTQESTTPLHSYAVCSDTEVGKKKNATAIDAVTTLEHELQYPATTDAKKLAENVEKHHDDEHMTVVFSTYHSINTVSDAQNEHQMHEFDLIICDEAHRTTGATHDSEDDSNFVKIHDGGFILGKKRLYMTATPRIFSDDVKDKATEFTLYSMDNEKLFGETLYTINFSEAVKRGLLVDYKVIVLTVDSEAIINKIGSTITENSEILVDDAARIVGCWKALSKQGIHTDVEEDTAPMQRALAFCQVIEQSEKARKHQVSSTRIANIFQTVVEAYQDAEVKEGNEISHRLICEAQHVDGGMGADKKEQKLNWLKATPEPVFDENEQERPICRVLSNVRCLSEGVDIPALDAVLFLTPRNSQVDVVQSVGRVMRTVKDPLTGENLKKKGYVILPVVIPPGVEPHKALDDNQTYKVVWQVLNALRSHDDRFDAMINKMDLTGIDKSKMEVIAISDKVAAKAKKKGAGKGGSAIGTPNKKSKKDDFEDTQHSFSFESGEIERAIVAKVVKKVGNRQYWEQWTEEIIKIAETHIKLITNILERPECEKERAIFEEFAHEIRDDLNNAVSNAEIIEMLAQHLITKPVFDALFDEYSFASYNPMAIAMQKVLDVLDQHHIDSETKALQGFYESVRFKASGITEASGKQKLILELYDNFFAKAFPKMKERLGIVYTPVDVVDFILHSVNDVLKQEFSKSFADEGVHILDPFTGTGTFISRLLQSGLIPSDKLVYKYKNEIHANELVLLAYYIAAINIEAVYHSEIIDDYTPFEGICLTDTFQMYEKEDLVDQVLVDNSARRKRQKSLDIQVIIGNPPYSAGQKSSNDNNENFKYPYLDQRIRETYVEESSATLNNKAYDSYLRALRWASDRIDENGVIGFVSGSGFIEKPSMSGIRKALYKEFSKIYIFNLRGDIRKNMLSKGLAGEGENIFENGSMTGIAITIFVKNQTHQGECSIQYIDIGDNLTTQEKLKKLRYLNSFMNVQTSLSIIEPNKYSDWIAQRDESNSDFIPIFDKSKSQKFKLFHSNSLGISTNRDPWVYNFSKERLKQNVLITTSFFNKQVDLIKAGSISAQDLAIDLEKISWSDDLRKKVSRANHIHFDHTKFYQAMYRPFVKQWLYHDRMLIDRPGKLLSLLGANHKNHVIALSGVGHRSGFSCLMIDCLFGLDTIEKSQCFPLYLYEEDEEDNRAELGDLFNSTDALNAREIVYQRKDGISDEGLQYFQTAYPSEQITKEDIFYYTYGLLHSEEYRTRYADNLTKELPRIPCVKKAEDFWVFSKAGRELAHWHLNYETIEPYKATVDTGSTAYNQLTAEDFYVEKMKFAKKGEKGTVIYNKRITIKDIPLEAYDYVVNGKPALDWIIDRQKISIDNGKKGTGILNDANDWAVETMNNPAYPLELFLRVITVSLETMKIVKSLPKLDI